MANPTAVGIMPRHTVLRTRELDEAVEFAARAWRPYDQVWARSRWPFEGEVQHVKGESLGFTYLDTESYLDIAVGELDRFCTVHVSLDGTSEHVAGGETVVCEPGVAVAHSPGQAVRYRRRGRGRFLVVRVDQDALERELAHLLGEPVRGRVTLAPRMALDGPAGRFARLAQALAGRLDTLPPGAPMALHLRQLERIVLGALLQAQPHGYGARRDAPTPEEGRAAVRRAEEFVRARLQHPLSVGDIARAVGVSARTLFRAFQRTHGCSPMDYVRRARLENVRRDLRSGSPGVRVTDVAHGWGFAHLGRFAGDYRRVFGETPSETLGRAATAR